MAQFLLLIVLASMLLELESETETRTWVSRRRGLALLRRAPTSHHALYREPCERAILERPIASWSSASPAPATAPALRRERVWHNNRRDIVSVHPRGVSLRMPYPLAQVCTTSVARECGGPVAWLLSYSVVSCSSSPLC